MFSCNLVTGCSRQIWVIIRKISNQVYVVLCISSNKSGCVRFRVDLSFVINSIIKQVEVYRHVVVWFRLMIG
ncbi:hypothetical protein [Candidatus Hodgkinia cicadicola]|uniref:hypothetical protein n=1 Tax=Candidatus Hodgkinia cicadicola TaxID=573658 RepID=UPI0011BA5A91